MKKRFFACLFVMLMLSLALVCLSSCGDSDKNEEVSSCQHRDADDNSLCDKCGESYFDGKDLPDICQHRDADDNSLCDMCGESYSDGKDVEDHTHEYNKQIVEDKYLATAADCAL